jgi:ZIP family zinc transporter
VLDAFLLGAFAQSSLLIVALLAYRLKNVSEGVIGQMAGLGAGALLGAAAFQLVPEAKESLGSLEISVWLLVGASVYVIADRIIERRFGEGGAMGIVVGNINDALPESLIFGIQLGTGMAFSPTLAASVWVSNIPQVFAPAEQLRKDGWPARKQAILWGSIVIASGIFAAVGYGFAAALGDIGGARIAAFTTGGLIAMLTTSMIPFAYKNGKLLAGIWAVVGFAATLAAS